MRDVNYVARGVNSRQTNAGANFRGCGSIFSPGERWILKDLQGKRWKDRNREKVRASGRKTYHKMKASGTLRKKSAAQERERSRRRRATNPSGILEYFRQYKAANRETLNRQTRSRNKTPKGREQQRVNNTRYQNKDRESYLAKRVRRYERNRAKHMAWTNADRMQNPDKYRNRCRTRRALKRGATIGDTAKIIAWEKNWRAQDAVKCFWCSKVCAPKTCDVDHIVALARGGSHSLDNLCVACARCNRKKSDKPVELWISQIKKNAIFWHDSASYEWSIRQGLHTPPTPNTKPLIYC